MTTAELEPAVFSKDRLYRYILRRKLESNDRQILRRDYFGPLCLFICLNPSTADEVHDDPTVRRCRGYATQWGFEHLEVANIFGLRSTDPGGLYGDIDPVGPDNNLHIYEAASRADFIIAAWGNHGQLMARGNTVLCNLHFLGKTIRHFGLTLKNQPKHPLYLSKLAAVYSFGRQ